MIRRLLHLPFRLLSAVLGMFARTGRNIATAFVQIWANKGRSILTTVGIVIAVSSTITVVAFVQGFGNQMTEMVRGYGTQFMVVRPFNPRERNRQGVGRVTLDMDDINAVRGECEHVHRISPFVFIGSTEVSYGLESVEDVPVRGVSEQYQTIRRYFVDAGRFFGPVEIDNAAQVIVLGRSLLKTLGCDDSIVGQYVQMDQERFLVIGLLESKGGLMGEDQDKTVMIPYTTAVNMYPRNRSVLFFLAEATSEETIPEAFAEITHVLRKRHDLQPGQKNDFHVERQDQALTQFMQVKNIASGILGGIVSISLLVGGIGVMNVMLVSVTERTREIGLRKSVGGRRRDIMMQFLTEAVVLCTLGGAMGVVLGYAVSYLASLHPKMIAVEVPLWAVALALMTSAGAGVVFGIIPAFKAAILHPIDALRHE